MTFNPGETSKTFRVLITDDKFVEGTEQIDLALSNPTGSGVGLGSPSVAQIKITDNDSVPSATNPIDDPAFFVRQQYLDFLNREPDAGGLAYWTNEITKCGSDARCIHERRIGVSAAFFVEMEFQETGYYIYRFYSTAFGRKPDYAEFTPDMSRISGFLTTDQLEAAKMQFAIDFTNRRAFASAYAALSNEAYVAALINTAIYQ